MGLRIIWSPANCFVRTDSRNSHLAHNPWSPEIGQHPLLIRVQEGAIKDSPSWSITQPYTEEIRIFSASWSWAGLSSSTVHILSTQLHEGKQPGWNIGHIFHCEEKESEQEKWFCFQNQGQLNLTLLVLPSFFWLSLDIFTGTCTVWVLNGVVHNQCSSDVSAKRQGILWSTRCLWA